MREGGGGERERKTMSWGRREGEANTVSKKKNGGRKLTHHCYRVARSKNRGLSRKNNYALIIT